MVRFFGKATGKVDDKGRIVFPAIFRDAMVRGGEAEMTLVVKKNVQQPCLDLFTYEEWVRRSDGKLGRLNIPSELLDQAGITKEVVFGGVGYKIQIWAGELREANLLSDEKFKDTATRLSAKK